MSHFSRQHFQTSSSSAAVSRSCISRGAVFKVPHRVVLVAREDDTPVGVQTKWLASPVTRAAPCPLDHGQERHEVVWLEIPFHDNIGPATRKLGIAEAIATVDRQTARSRHPPESGNILL